MKKLIMGCAIALAGSYAQAKQVTMEMGDIVAASSMQAYTKIGESIPTKVALKKPTYAGYNLALSVSGAQLICSELNMKVEIYESSQGSVEKTLEVHGKNVFMSTQPRLYIENVVCTK